MKIHKTIVALFIVFLSMNSMFATDAAVADNEAAGVTAKASLAGSGTEADPFAIATLDDLKCFRDLVNSGTTYDNQSVKLMGDIDLNSVDWTPIGNGTNKFLGTFDGNGKTISNLCVDMNTTNAGLFGFASVIMNLTISNATVKGLVSVGAMVGELESSVGTLDNCHVIGHIEVTGENSVGGLAGKGYANIRNSSVIGDGVSASFVLGEYGSAEEGDNVGGLIGHLGEGNTLGVANSAVKDIRVAGTRKIGGLVGTTARANDYVGNTVENVTVESTATAEYAANNASTCTIGGIIGNYFGSATSGGILKGCTVKSVTFVCGYAKSAGALVGGDRVNNGGEPVGVEPSGNTVYMSTVIGAQNKYLMVPVAQIGAADFYAFEEAIDAAQSGDTIKLLANVTGIETVTINKTVILDLNGKTIENTSANAYVLRVDDNSTLTLTDTSTEKNGTIKGSKGINVAKGSKLIMDDGNIAVTGATGAAIQVYGSEAVMDGGTITAEYGAILLYSNGDARGTFTMNGGEMNTKSVSIFANGSEEWDNVDVTVNGGKITSTEAAAIYWPAAGKLTINDGELTGLVAVYVKSGSLEITGGTLTGNGEKVDYNYNETVSGFSSTGDALVIENVGGTTGYEAVGSVAIKGGTFISENAAAVASYAAGNEGADVVTGFISDGTFSSVTGSAIDEDLLNAGLKFVENENGTYGVEVDPAYGKVARIGDTYYATIAEAIASAKDGDTVTLLADITSVDGVIITDKKLAINLNGKTYAVSEGASTNNRNLKINGASEVVISNGTMVAQDDYGTGAYGTVRTEDSANVVLQGLKLYNYRGNGLNIKAMGNSVVQISDTEIYSQYGGGVEAAGGTVKLDNVTIEQKGMYTAPYNSMAISVNGGGKAIVNSGTYSTVCLTAEEAYNQGSSHGPWCVGVLDSGGTLVINGGTFSNDNYGDNVLATAARGLILADTGAIVKIKGGVFTALKGIVDIQNNHGDASRNPTGTIAGGVFSADPSNSYVTIAEGYQSVKQPEETLWKVGRLPNAEVGNMGPTEITEYSIYNGSSLSEGTNSINLQVALEFIAKDTPEQASANAYGKYTTDFYITINGAKDGSFVADGCYLAGNYGTFGWIMIPLDGMTIVNGKVYPLISSVGFDFKYEDICTSVKDFKCGIYFSQAVLDANPDLSVSLNLGLSESLEQAQNATFVQAIEEPFVYDVEAMTLAIAIAGPYYYTTVTGAVEAAVQTGDFVKLVDDAVPLEDDLAIDGDLVFNLNGGTLSANGKTLAIADSAVTITNGTLDAFTTDNVTLEGNAILTVTDKIVADRFRTSDAHYVSQNANGTYSIMLKTAFRVFITVVDGEPRIGFFKDCAAGAPTYTIKGAANLETPEWTEAECEEATDADGASMLPLYWMKPAESGIRFFKLSAE